MSKKLLFVVTEDWYLVSHRLPLAIAAQQAGFKVSVATRLVKHQHIITEHGLQVIPFNMERRGLDPLHLIREIYSLVSILRRERPDIIHLVALRPVIVGGIATYLAGISNVVFALTGMGFLFTDGGRLPWIRKTIQKSLPWLLSRGLTIVQNQDDAEQLIGFGLPKNRLRLIPGSGVDVKHFVPGIQSIETAPDTIDSLPIPIPIPIVMMASRLLWDKGLAEFIAAAKILQNQHCRFVLVGTIDNDNPASASEDDIKGWIAAKIIEWWGHSTDMATVLSQADIVCLPSYREGLPKVLLEAMACGKPCISTDVPGCRAAVTHQDNGLLVPVKDATALATAIKQLLDDLEQRHRLGIRGRERAVNEFSQERIIEKTLAVYQEVMA